MTVLEEARYKAYKLLNAFKQDINIENYEQVLCDKTLTDNEILNYLNKINEEIISGVIYNLVQAIKLEYKKEDNVEEARNKAYKFLDNFKLDLGIKNLEEFKNKTLTNNEIIELLNKINEEDNDMLKEFVESTFQFTYDTKEEYMEIVEELIEDYENEIFEIITHIK